jgi:molybdopterin synthase catalytic subunit
VEVSITIQAELFDVSRETAFLQGGNRATGAMVSFVGLVRDTNDGAAVRGLTLEHYPGMAEKEIKNIVAEAGVRWPLEAVRVVHRIGTLEPSDFIVFVGVASRHRGDAFAACEYIMDSLKTRVAFWKKEQTGEGDRWLEARPADRIALQKWQK